MKYPTGFRYPKTPSTDSTAKGPHQGPLASGLGVGSATTGHAFLHGSTVRGSDVAVGTPYDERDRVNNQRLVELGMKPWYEFLSTEEPKWIVEDILPAGRQTHLIAPAGKGKTLFTQGLIMAIVEGVPFADRYETRPARILWLDYENGWPLIQDRFASFGYSDDSGQFDLKTVIFLEDRVIYWPFPDTSELPALNTELGAFALVERCEAFGIDLVVVDSMGLAIDGDENSADTYRDFGRYTGKAMRDHEIAMLLLDNTGKNENKGARGSSRKKDEADLQWKLESNPTGYTLTRVKDRLGAVPKQISIKLEDDPYLRWSSVKSTKASAQATKIIQKMKADRYAPTSRRQALGDGYRGSATYLSEAVRWMKEHA